MHTADLKRRHTFQWPERGARIRDKYKFCRILATLPTALSLRPREHTLLPVAAIPNSRVILCLSSIQDLLVARQLRRPSFTPPSGSVPVSGNVVVTCPGFDATANQQPSSMQVMYTYRHTDTDKGRLTPTDRQKQTASVTHARARKQARKHTLFDGFASKLHIAAAMQPQYTRCSHPITAELHNQGFAQNSVVT
jgi:hypothetical protein